VVRRAEAPEPDFEVLQDVVATERLERFRDHQVEMPETPISSSQIRELIAAEGAWRKLVPEGVAQHIERESLYR
jgi:nicotinic acid mononucleotide adenylyltransferase